MLRLSPLVLRFKRNGAVSRSGALLPGSMSCISAPFSQKCEDGKKYKVLVTHPEVSKVALGILTPTCELIMCQNQPPKRSEILEKVKGVHGILWACKLALNAEVLDAAGPGVKSISVITSGFDFVDIPELKKRKISFGNVGPAVKEAVADFAIGMMVAAARRFHEGRLKIASSTWENYHIYWMLGQDTEGATMGFFGFGGIAQTIAQRLTGFEISRILYTADRSCGEEVEEKYCAKRVQFDELLAESDFLFNIAPLTADTKGIFNTAAFNKMKKTAVFINVGRGLSVKQDDLVSALEKGTIFSAAVDVMFPEPLPADRPLLCLPNLIITPHLGASTPLTRMKMATTAAKNVLLGLSGEPMCFQLLTSSETVLAAFITKRRVCMEN